MKDTAFFALARRQFHAALLQTTLTRSPAGVVSNADGSSVDIRDAADRVSGVGERRKLPRDAPLAAARHGPPQKPSKPHPARPAPAIRRPFTKKSGTPFSATLLHAAMS